MLVGRFSANRSGAGIRKMKHQQVSFEWDPSLLDNGQVHK